MKITTIKKFVLNDFERRQVQELSSMMWLPLKDIFTEKDVKYLNRFQSRDTIYFEVEVNDILSMCERYCIYVNQQMAEISSDTAAPVALKQHICDNYKLQLKNCDRLRKIFVQPDIDSDE